jgi:hypothetical protein
MVSYQANSIVDLFLFIYFLFFNILCSSTVFRSLLLFFMHLLSGAHDLCFLCFGMYLFFFVDK